MRIAWFTPFKKASAIGRFSRSVTTHLARHAQVDLWVADSGGLHDTSLRVIPYTTIRNAAHFLSEYDAVVYNLGDNLANHKEIYDMSRRVPGIVILHDLVMHHFFAGYYLLPGNWQGYLRAMRRWYGKDVLPDQPNFGDKACRIWESDRVYDYPLFEETVPGARAVIAHSDFLAGRVAKITSAPVRKINLAYEIERQPSPLSRTDLGIPAGRKLAVTIGHVNENKRVHVVLEALANSPTLREKMMYVVVGPLEGPFGEKVQELCTSRGLQDAVRFTGYASDELLHAYLRHADLCINLRLPAMEGASASCIEEMLHGKPVIVTDTGFYAELPDDCVKKVRPAHELQDLNRHLNRLITDSKAAAALGARARRYADDSFTPEGYALQFLALATELAGLTPAYDLAATVGAELRAIGVTPDMAIVDTIARESGLFDGDFDPPILRTATPPPGASS